MRIAYSIPLVLIGIFSACIVLARAVGFGVGFALGAPRGAWLAYSAEYIAGLGDIVLYDTVTGRAHNLTRTPDQHETRPVWSPDGRWLTFECQSDDTPPLNHCRANEDRLERWHIDGVSWAFRPRWSPDGATLSYSTFAREMSVPITRYALYAAPASAAFTSATRRSARQIGATDSAMIYAWLPDSAHIVYNAYDARASRVYIASLDGTPPALIPQPESDNYEPAPSPDGRWIAFVSVNGYKRRLMLYDAAAQTYAPLTDGGGIGNDFAPAWSPDSTRLAFLSDRDGADFDLFMIDIATRAETQIIANYFLDDNFAWSPDGTQIALMSNRDGAFNVYIHDLISGGVVRVSTPLTQGGAFNNFPAWRP
jgi:TolB protein